MANSKFDSYEEMLSFVLDHEGRVNEDVKDDPGGKTHWGITQVDFNAWLEEQGKPHRDVFTMTEAEVQAVYKVHYWNPIRGDKLPSEVALVLFDGAVNQGIRWTVQQLQKTLGVDADGAIGPQTLGAVDTYVKAHGAGTLASSLIARRDLRYHAIVESNPSLGKFLKGWLNRLADLRKAVLV